FGLCKRGHEMTPENTYVDKRGYGTCRECRRERDDRISQFERLEALEHQVASLRKRARGAEERLESIITLDQQLAELEVFEKRIEKMVLRLRGDFQAAAWAVAEKPEGGPRTQKYATHEERLAARRRTWRESQRRRRQAAEEAGGVALARWRQGHQ